MTNPSTNADDHPSTNADDHPSTNADDRTTSNDAERPNAGDGGPNPERPNAGDGGPNPERPNAGDGGPDADDRTPPDRAADLAAVVVERDLEPDQYTVYPRDASDEDLVTQWITAEEGSYVELESMR